LQYLLKPSGSLGDPEDDDLVHEDEEVFGMSEAGSEVDDVEDMSDVGDGGEEEGEAEEEGGDPHHTLKFCGIHDSICFPLLFPFGGGYAPLSKETTRSTYVYQQFEKNKFWRHLTEVSEEYVIKQYLYREDDFAKYTRTHGVRKSDKSRLLPVSHIGSIAYVREMRSVARHLMRKFGAVTDFVTGTTSLTWRELIPADAADSAGTFLIFTHSITGLIVCRRQCMLRSHVGVYTGRWEEVITA
jgi:hypothetical protein